MCAESSKSTVRKRKSQICHSFGQHTCQLIYVYMDSKKVRLNHIVQSLQTYHMQMCIIEVFICRRLHMNTSMIHICIWLICRLCLSLLPSSPYLLSLTCSPLHISIHVHEGGVCLCARACVIHAPVCYMCMCKC